MVSGRPGPFGDVSFREVHRSRAVDLVADVAGADWSAGPRAPYAAMTVVRARRGTLRAGLDLVYAAHDGRRMRLVADDRELAARRVRLPVGATLGLVLCERHATVFVRTSTRWRPVLTARLDAGPDPRDPAVLSRTRWVEAGDAAGETRHGPFGMVGLRDVHLVTHADGTPYTREGRVFLTMTCAGPGGFRQGHWGVFAMDPAKPESVHLVSLLWFARDGLVLGDCAGHLVRDGDQWLAVTSTWADFDTRRGAHVRVARTDADLLTGGHVLASSPLSLPVGDEIRATWDPVVMRTDGEWLVAFVEASSVAPGRFRFRPATAAGPLDGLRRLASVESSWQTEGPVLVRRDGRTWLLASDGERRRFVVADPRSGAHVGEVEAAYGSNIPHPQLVPRADGSWLMVSFDGTRLEPRRRHLLHHRGRRPLLPYGTHGDLVVQVSD